MAGSHKADLKTPVNLFLLKGEALGLFLLLVNFVGVLNFRVSLIYRGDSPLELYYFSFNKK